MFPRFPARLARRAALAVAALAVVAASGTPTTVIDWVAAHDMVDVPYVRDCHGILRHPEECPPSQNEPVRTSALR
jgi:hypothetical protein